jgi:hypothetical protein
MPADSGLSQNNPVTMVSGESSILRREMREEYLRVVRKRLFNILINSTTIFILTYLLSYLFYQLIARGFAALVDINSVLYYFEIKYGISNLSSQWTPGRILAVSAVPAVLSLAAGSFYLFGLVRKLPFRRYYRLFLIWLGFHSINMFFGGILAGSVTGEGFGYALDVFFWPVYIIYFILILIGIFCLGVIGYDYTDQFLKINSSGYWSRRKNRMRYLLFSLVLPYLIGSLLIFLVKIPDHKPQHQYITFHDLILSLSMVFLIIPMLFRSKDVRVHPKTDPTEKQQNILWVLVISTIVFVIWFRLGLT